jgi:hypothetical protein
MNHKTDICVIPNLRNGGEHMANAHLLKAAPDLLAACKELRACWATMGEQNRTRLGHLIDSAVGMVNEAIAKAEGAL